MSHDIPVENSEGWSDAPIDLHKPADAFCGTIAAKALITGAFSWRLYRLGLIDGRCSADPLS
jgi:hypothetical protein